MRTSLHSRTAAENRLVVCSAAENKYCMGLLAGFAERFPGIEIEFRGGISVALHERFMSIGINRDLGYLLDQRRRRALLQRWQAAVAGLGSSVESPLSGDRQ